MAADRYYEDIAVGETGTTDSRTVTETDVSLYSGLTGEYDPRHSDATEGRRSAQPYLVVALAVPLHMGINEHAYGYGFDDVVFHEPTYLGDTIHVEWEYVEKTGHDDKYGRVTTHADVRTQRDETTIEYRFHRLLDRAAHFAPDEV